MHRFAWALCQDDGEAEALALAWLARTGSPDRVEEELLAPAARLLGVWWETDALSFAAVTLGMATLQRILWRVGRADPAATQPFAPRQRRLLLACAPGEAHSFGLNLLCEQLRRRGGWPAVLPSPSAVELEKAVRTGGFDVVGLSVGSEPTLDALPALSRRLRRASPGPLQLLAGGPAAHLLLDRPDRGGMDEVVSGAPLERLCVVLFGPRHDPGLETAAAAA